VQALGRGLLGAAILACALLGETSGRTLGILLPALLLAAALSAGAAALALANRGLAPQRREFLVPVALFLAAMCLAAWRGSDPGDARIVLLEWGTGALVAAVLAGWAGPRAAVRAAAAVAAAGAALAVYALYQRGWGLAFVAKAFEADPGLAGPVPAFPGAREAALARVQTPEPYATFALSNTLAGLMLLCAPLALSLAWERWARERRPVAALVLALAGGACGAVLWMTGSKGAWLAGGLAAAAFGLWRMRGRRAPLMLLGVLLLAGALGWASSSPSLSFRLGYWSAGARMVLAHPWGGLGLGGFDSEYNRYRPVWARDVHRAHCDPLQLWAEAGLWALLGFLWLSGLCWQRGARVRSGPPAGQDPALARAPPSSPSWGWAAALGASIGGVLLLFPTVLPPAYFGGSGTLRAWVGAAMALAGAGVAWAADAAWGEGGRRGALLGVLALGIHALGDFDLSVPGVGLCGWAMLGALAAGSPDEIAARASGRGALGIVFVLIAGSWGLLGGVALPVLETEEAVAEARDLMRQDARPLPDPAYRRLGQALSLGAAGSLAWETLGEAEERRWRAGSGDPAFRASVDARDRAGRMRPGNPVPRLALATLCLKAGRGAEALSWADAAVASFPTAPLGHLNSARIRRRVIETPALLAGMDRARLADEVTQAYRRALALDGEILEEGQRLTPAARSEAEAWLR
jgi:hypothetical protein